MNGKITRALSMVTALLLLSLALTGCTAKKPPLNGTATNDILTFQNNQANKPIVRIGMQYYTPNNLLVEALEKRFPDYLFVLDYGLAAGSSGAEERVLTMLERQTPLDLVISARGNFKNKDIGYYVDLSAERFLDNYLLSSLNNISVDERIYFLPGVSSLTGIAYNTELFEQNGWQIPADTEEFFELCETIKATGIAPISHCFKYASQVNTTFGTMCYDQLYMSAQDSKWLKDVQTGDAAFTGHMEPFFELVKRYSDAGLATLADFSASLTKQRQAFWAGECAMIFYNSSIFTYAQAENAPFKVGIMPFPAAKRESSGFSTMPEYYISIPKTVEKDPKRLALMKDILAFISTPEGQQAMLSGSLSVSNVKNIDLSDNPAFSYMKQAYDRGNLYPSIEYPLVNFDMLLLQQNSVKHIFEGGSVQSALAMMDQSIKQALTEGVPAPAPDVLATAERDFTMLETSYYIADKLKAAAGADIALMINGGYFRSNLYSIPEGDINSDLNHFVMKGVGATDYLTTYSLTGAQIKQLLERPIVNGTETDVLIAASGLKLEYAPWNARGERVIKLTLADSKPLDDTKTYKVAAWAGAIDAKYITETLQTHESLGTLTDILAQALKQDKKIKPDIADRLKLVWPKAK